jgi:hypothetical protein
VPVTDTELSALLEIITLTHFDCTATSTNITELETKLAETLTGILIDAS